MSGSRRQSPFDPRRVLELSKEQRVPALCAAALVLAAVLVIPYRISQNGYLNDVSGVWAALADDVTRGVLYRPLVSELGYGGTRYFPLHFTLHGALAALGLPLIAAGHLVSLAASVLLVVAGALGLQRYGASPVLSWSVALLALASRTSFIAVAGIRGDILPLALAVLGLALTPRSRAESTLPSALLFAAAFLTKPTVLWAPAAAVGSLALGRRWGEALRLGLSAAAVGLGGLVLSNWISGGAMLESFRACASGGGFSLSLLFGSMTLIRPGEVAWMLGGFAMVVLAGRRALTHPFCAAVPVCLAATAVLYTGRGMHVNHFIDAVAVGALAIGAVSAMGVARRASRAVLVGCAVLGVSEAVLLDGMVLKRGELAAAARALPPGKDPVLSEQGWVPLVAGESSFLLDAYGLLQTRLSSKAVDDDFLGRMDRCGFRAVVLIGRAEATPFWYDDVRFGHGFRERLARNYRLDRIAGAHALYLPRCGKPDAGTPAERDVPGETVAERIYRPNPLKVMLKRLLGSR